MREILLSGSGELGKEFMVPAQRKGRYITTYDSCAGIPVMQVANGCGVFSTLGGDALERAIHRHEPDITVSEIKAIRTERSYDFGKEGIQVVPSARAVNFTMSRKITRDLTARELRLEVARYFYAKSPNELKTATKRIGFPCVVKPLISSSGKRRSFVRSADELRHAWEYGCNSSYDNIRELIVEEFTEFDNKITSLTITQKNGPTLSCPPIGHVQKGSGYRESFQPAHIDPTHLEEAQEMAEKATRTLTRAGLWGVKFSLSCENGAYFSRLSPRSYNTGMITLAETQNLSEFELHCHAILDLPIPSVKQERIGAGVVILSTITSQERPNYRGMEEATKEGDTYLRVSGKPTTRVNRRMGVVLCYAPLDNDLDALRDKAKRITGKVEMY